MFSYTPLSSVPLVLLSQLLNHPDIKRHMPLAGSMSEAECRSWAEAKDHQWQENGYGPWAIYNDGQFVGWGGFQKEGDDVDLGLVLRPDAWGLGPMVVRDLIAKGWSDFGFASITVLLPPSRVHLRPLARLGFVPDGELEYEGEKFRRFRLHRP
ncbi:hypothetical protein IAD21_00739 [Abditibacteriota bacterium]|nr:hypothetical protein IAD21_00739 [Abditibacteriota bacterium]